ncbi:MAG TPA: hypothetical protein EYN91_08645 [Candidatus Melainabacteria bacterium]|nr:hypothetical protein [Candidatus Melainabacteria bacterium]
MFHEQDNNQDGKLGKFKHIDRDRDSDIDIDITINGDVNFRPPFGGGGCRPDLNLCDVAQGIGDIVRNDRAKIGASAVEEVFKDFKRTKEDEPPFIDCRWDRLVDATKQEMVHKHARLGASLKDAQG